MSVLFIYLTYNRPKVLEQCLTTSLQNTDIVPEEAWIIDDASEPNVQASLFKMALDNRGNLPINLMLRNKNEGIGWTFEHAYNLMKMKACDYVCLMESDYIWRKGWLEDCLAVFEANPHVIAIPGCDHPDMYDRNKTHNLFPRLMMEQFPTDVKGRNEMYIPFDLATNRGNIKVFGASNSCGCAIYAWNRMEKMFKDIGRWEEYWKWMDRAFNKHEGGDRRNASDQHMSCSVTWYWYEYAIKHGLDLTKNFPWLNICDMSISNHLCGGGINGMIVPEGQTFVGAPSWNPKYLDIDPRK